MKNMEDNDPIKFNDNFIPKIKKIINKLKQILFKPKTFEKIFSTTDYLKPVSFVDVYRVTDVSHLFDGCKTLKSVEVNNGREQIKRRNGQS